MTVATLGVELKGIAGFDRGSTALEKFTAASKKVETAAAGMAAKAESAAARVGKIFPANTHAARFAQQIDKSNQSLRGFEAVAARAAEQAEYMTRQIQQMSAHEIRDAGIQEYGREMDRLRAKFNPLFAASKQYEASLDEINYAHRVGAITIQEQSAAIARLDAQYEQAARAANTLTAANRSMRGSFHTTNLLFQAQDIAMMTAMGQAPLMLAMQQGMQVGGIFHQIGGGRQIVQALGGAILGLLNPLNLATIAFIGLGAAGVQALMNMSSQWGSTKQTFEEHVEWLNKMLRGYDDLQESVGDFLDKASRMPAELARLEIGAGITDQLRELEQIQQSLANFRIRDDALFNTTSLNEELAIIRELKAQLDGGLMTATEFAEKMLIMSLNPNLQSDSRAVVQQLFEMVRRAAELEAGIGGARLAMQGLSDDALLAAQRMSMLVGTFDMLDNLGETSVGLQNILDGQVEAMEKLTDMVPEIRTQQQIAADLLEKALGSPSAELRAQAQEAYDLFMRNTAIMDARREAEKAAGKDSPYELATKAVNDNIRALEQQALAFGLSETAASRFNTAMDLLKAAQEAGIPITSGLINEINGLADAYALAEERTRQLQQQQQLAIDINNTLAQGFSNMFTGIIDGSKNAGQAIGDLLKSLGQLLINNAFMMLFGGGTGGGIGGMFAGLFSFDGGGFTGYGPRSGGIDGRGGFPAILHPNETVIDHTLAANANRPVASTHTSGGDVYVTIERIVANSEAEGAAAARGFQAEMRRWQESGEGARYVRAVVNNPGRSNPRAA